MDRYIEGVAYRHALLTAYVKVVGRTEVEAKQRAKRVGRVLLDRMPTAAEVAVPRYRGMGSGRHVYEVPVLIAACVGPAKAELAKLVLQGAA